MKLEGTVTEIQVGEHNSQVNCLLQKAKDGTCKSPFSVKFFRILFSFFDRQRRDDKIS